MRLGVTPGPASRTVDRRCLDGAAVPREGTCRAGDAKDEQVVPRRPARIGRASGHRGPMGR